MKSPSHRRTMRAVYRVKAASWAAMWTIDGEGVVHLSPKLELQRACSAFERAQTRLRCESEP